MKRAKLIASDLEGGDIRDSNNEEEKEESLLRRRKRKLTEIITNESYDIFWREVHRRIILQLAERENGGGGGENNVTRSYRSRDDQLRNTAIARLVHSLSVERHKLTAILCKDPRRILDECRVVRFRISNCVIMHLLAVDTNTDRCNNRYPRRRRRSPHGEENDDISARQLRYYSSAAASSSSSLRDELRFGWLARSSTASATASSEPSSSTMLFIRTPNVDLRSDEIALADQTSFRVLQDTTKIVLETADTNILTEIALRRSLLRELSKEEEKNISSSSSSLLPIIPHRSLRMLLFCDYDAAECAQAIIVRSLADRFLRENSFRLERRIRRALIEQRRARTQRDQLLSHLAELREIARIDRALLITAREHESELLNARNGLFLQLAVAQRDAKLQITLALRQIEQDMQCLADTAERIRLEEYEALNDQLQKLQTEVCATAVRICRSLNCVQRVNENPRPQQQPSDSAVLEGCCDEDSSGDEKTIAITTDRAPQTLTSYFFGCKTSDFNDDVAACRECFRSRGPEIHETIKRCHSAALMLLGANTVSQILQVITNCDMLRSMVSTRKLVRFADRFTVEQERAERLDATDRITGVRYVAYSEHLYKYAWWLSCVKDRIKRQLDVNFSSVDDNHQSSTISAAMNADTDDHSTLSHSPSPSSSSSFNNIFEKNTKVLRRLMQQFWQQNRAAVSYAVLAQWTGCSLDNNLLEIAVTESDKIAVVSGSTNEDDQRELREAATNSFARTTENRSTVQQQQRAAIEFLREPVIRQTVNLSKAERTGLAFVCLVVTAPFVEHEPAEEIYSRYHHVTLATR